MLRKILENKYVRIFDIVYLTLLSFYTIIRIYLIMISPIPEPDLEGYALIYYSPRSAILCFVLLIFIFIISNIFFYIIDCKIKNERHTK